jgi:hypothetical protein
VLIGPLKRLLGARRCTVSRASDIDDPRAKKKRKAKESQQPTTRRYRDAATGRFVTKKDARKNRKTTIKESAARPL